jgi:hypothetical protein
MKLRWRLVFYVAIVPSPILYFGTMWWFIHQYLTKSVIEWGQTHLGWMFLG